MEDTIERKKVTDWEKIFTKHIFDKELISKLYKENS